MLNALTIDDLKAMARRRVPKLFFDYADSGAWTESTYRANEADFARILLRQRVLVDMAGRSLASEMVGEPVAMPVGLAPTGLTGMQHADGEILAAQAAEAFGVPFCLSTMSICSIEDVAGATKQPFWFQLYVMRDRDFVANLIDRAKAAGCAGLVLTLDLQILGQRHKDLRNGLSAPPRFTAKHVWQVATRPFWAMEMLGTRAAELRQHHRTREERRRPAFAVVLDQRAVRPPAVVGGRRLDPGALGRQADPQGHPRPRGRPARRRDRRRRADRLEPRRAPARRRALVDLGAAADRRRRRRPDRDAHGRRRPLRAGRAEGGGARRARRLDRPVRSSTGSAPAAGRAWPGRSRSSGASSTSRWRSAAGGTSAASTRRSSTARPASPPVPAPRPTRVPKPCSGRCIA